MYRFISGPVPNGTLHGTCGLIMAAAVKGVPFVILGFRGVNASVCRYAPLMRAFAEVALKRAPRCVTKVWTLDCKGLGIHLDKASSVPTAVSWILDQPTH